MIVVETQSNLPELLFQCKLFKISLTVFVFAVLTALFSVGKYMFSFSELSLLNKAEYQLYLASVAGFSTRSV